MLGINVHVIDVISWESISESSVINDNFSTNIILNSQLNSVVLTKLNVIESNRNIYAYFKSYTFSSISSIKSDLQTLDFVSWYKSAYKSLLSLLFQFSITFHLFIHCELVACTVEITSHIMILWLSLTVTFSLMGESGFISRACVVSSLDWAWHAISERFGPCVCRIVATLWFDDRDFIWHDFFVTLFRSGLADFRRMYYLRQ